MGKAVVGFLNNWEISKGVFGIYYRLGIEVW